MSITITTPDSVAAKYPGATPDDPRLSDLERRMLEAHYKEQSQRLEPFGSLMEGSNTQQQFPGYGGNAPLLNGMADDQGQVYADSTVGGNSVADLVSPEVLELVTGDPPPPLPAPSMTYNPGQGGQANAPQRPSYGAPTQRPQLQMGGRQPQAMSVTAGRQNTAVNTAMNQNMTNMNRTGRRSVPAVPFRAELAQLVPGAGQAVP